MATHGAFVLFSPNNFFLLNFIIKCLHPVQASCWRCSSNLFSFPKWPVMCRVRRQTLLA